MIERLIFVGMGEVGHRIVQEVLASDEKIEMLKRYSFVLIDNDKIEPRNPSYRAYSRDLYKVSVAGYELSMGLRLPVLEKPYIPLSSKGIVIVPKRVTIQELSLLNSDKNLIIETTDNFVMQDITGLHIHTGSLLNQHIGYSIRYGSFKLKTSKSEIGDCPERFSNAAKEAARYFVSIFTDILANNNPKIKAIMNIVPNA